MASMGLNPALGVLHLVLLTKVGDRLIFMVF